jgi:hypothetical protein
MPVPRRRWLLTLALLLVPSAARATDAIAAQALFDEAKQLMADGRYTAACPKFAESQQADPGLGTQFHLADCWQHVGRMASAWALFRDVESQAHTRGENGRERVAHDRAAALEPFLPRLVVLPHEVEAVPGLTIRRDGIEIGREQWGVAVPIDPGTHAVAVYAPGKQPWGTGVEVPMDGKTITIDVPPLSTLLNASAVAVVTPPRPPLAAVAPAPGVTSMMPEGLSGGPSETPVVENRGGAQRAVGWFFVGAGVVGLASGAYFGSQWLNYRNESDPHCPGDACDAAGAQLRSNATTQGRAAIISGGGGAVALILGAALVATAPGPRVVSTPTARLQVVPVVDTRRGGLALQGVW